MKAIVNTTYGLADKLELTQLPQPTPKDNEVLIRVHTASLNAADWHLLRGKPYMLRLDGGLRKPKYNILGADVAGTIEAIGSSVSKFQIGDEVFGDLSSNGFGSFADYVCASEDVLISKPSTLSFEEAAALPMAAVTALQGLKKGTIQAGQRVLINGASGGVGTFAVQIAKALETDVTAICSTSKINTVQSLGADTIIDYTKTSFSEIPEHYDLIFAANGNESVQSYKRLLNPNGICVVSGGAMSQIFQALLLAPFLSLSSTKKVCSLLAKPNVQDLRFITELVKAGKIKPILDKQFDLEDLPEAMSYFGKGHAKGKIIIKNN